MEMYVFTWLVFCGCVAALAYSKGRSPLLWFLIAVAVSPLLAGIVVLVMKDEKVEAQRRYAAQQRRLLERRREREDREERRQMEEERRRERRESRRMQAALLSRLTPPPPADYSQVPTPRNTPALRFDDEPPPLPGEDQGSLWFVVIQGKKIGPLDLPQLTQLAKQRKINKHTRVWTRGMQAWLTMAETPALIEAIRRTARSLG